MKLLTVLFFTLLTFAPIESHAAKAVAVVVSTLSGQSVVYVQLYVSEDSGVISFGTSFAVNFASSTNQMNADIKSRVRDILIGYGIPITVNDIVLFGGAQ